MAMQNINSVLLGLVQMMNNFTTIDANKDGVISQDEVNIWAASVIPNASQEELPLYDIFTSQKTDGSKNELGAANFKALANGDDTVNNDDIARMQKFLTPLDPNAPGSTTLLYGGQPLNRDETLELLVQNGTLTREQADKYKADNATLEEIKIVLKPTPFATMENTNPANPEDPASTLKRVNQAIDKLVEQGQLTQEKANELKAQAAEDPTKVWISLVGIGGNLTTSEKTIEDRIKQACEEANKQAPGLNLNPQDWINNLSSETSLESILSTIKTNAMMYNNMNNPDSTSAETPEQTTEAVAIFIPDQTLMTKEIKLAGLALLENDFDKIDKDKDGILSKNEIKSWEKENVKKIGAGSYDENGNWVVDPVKEEQEKAYKVFYSGSTADNNFAELANGDDTVSLDDIIAMKSKLSTN